MKILKILLIITLVALNFGCEKPEIAHSSDTTINSKTNFKFYIDVDIDGEKFSYSVDTFDMYVKNLYPVQGVYFNKTDQLIFGYGFGSIPLQVRGHLETDGQLIGNFGNNSSSFPKIGFYLQIPYFSKLKVGEEITNDTISIWNFMSKQRHAEYFLFHIEKWKKPFALLDSNTYDHYEGGVFRGVQTISRTNRIKPSLNTIKFKLISKKDAIIKTKSGKQNVQIINGEITGKMLKYNEYISTTDISYISQGYSNVKIKFNLPNGIY